jgi:hypothetical protein
MSSESYPKIPLELFRLKLVPKLPQHCFQSCHNTAAETHNWEGDLGELTLGSMKVGAASARAMELLISDETSRTGLEGRRISCTESKRRFDGDIIVAKIKYRSARWPGEL